MDQYARTRPGYSGVPMSDAYKIVTILVSSVISQLQRGKAPDIEGLTAEHLQYCQSPFGCRIISKVISAHHDIWVRCHWIQI